MIRVRWYPFSAPQSDQCRAEGISRRRISHPKVRQLGAVAGSLMNLVLRSGKQKASISPSTGLNGTPNPRTLIGSSGLPASKSCQNAVVDSLFQGLLHRGPRHQQSPDAHRRDRRRRSRSATRRIHPEQPGRNERDQGSRRPLSAPPCKRRSLLHHQQRDHAFRRAAAGCFPRCVHGGDPPAVVRIARDGLPMIGIDGDSHASTERR